jgi:hypothetical protein
VALTPKERADIVREVVSVVAQARLEVRVLEAPEAAPESIWNSKMSIALVPTLGAVLIASGWQSCAARSAAEEASRQRDYDQKIELKRAFDSAMSQLDSVETTCTRAVVGSFQQLKRKWLIEPMLASASNTPGRTATATANSLQQALEQSKLVESTEVGTRARAHDELTGKRPLNTYADEIRAIFDADTTHLAATNFAEAWSKLCDHGAPEHANKIKAAMRSAATQVRDAIMSGKNVRLDVNELSKTHEQFKSDCRERSSRVRLAYRELAMAVSVELRQLRNGPTSRPTAPDATASPTTPSEYEHEQ